MAPPTPLVKVESQRSQTPGLWYSRSIFFVPEMMLICCWFFLFQVGRRGPVAQHEAGTWEISRNLFAADLWIWGILWNFRKLFQFISFSKRGVLSYSMPCHVLNTFCTKVCQQTWSCSVVSCSVVMDIYSSCDPMLGVFHACAWEYESNLNGAQLATFLSHSMSPVSISYQSTYSLICFSMLTFA